MDILYIVGQGSTENNAELMYSLRSVEKFCKGVQRIFITGICPNFINRKKVVFTACDDPYCRNLNHFYKVYNTLITTDISDNFLLMYDDIFFCRPVDIRKYKWFYKGQLPEKANNSYQQGLVNSRKWLQENVFPTKDFTTHTPCIYNRTLFCGLFSIFNDLRDDVHGMSPRCIYSNQFVEKPVELTEDVKIRTQKFGINDAVETTGCFSTGDFTFNVAKNWLYENLMWKSRWEK